MQGDPKQAYMNISNMLNIFQPNPPVLPGSLQTYTTTTKTYISVFVQPKTPVLPGSVQTYTTTNNI